jgi:hypothetical protein
MLSMAALMFGPVTPPALAAISMASRMYSTEQTPRM